MQPNRPPMPDRLKFIGGSDVGAALGVSPWTTPFKLFQKKTGAYVEEMTPAKKRILERGHRWEPIVLEMTVDELVDRGHDVEVVAVNERYVDPEYAFMACEIDAELIVDGEPVNAEMKTANVRAADGWGDYDSEDVPIYYLAQVMYGLSLRPRRRTVISAVTGFDDRPMIRWVNRDEDLIQGIRTRVIEFWNRIQTNNPPDPITASDVKWLYQIDSGEVLEADEALIDHCYDLKELKKTAGSLEGRMALLETRIKLRMKDAAVLLGPDGRPLATWKTNRSSKETDWKSAYEDLKPEAAHVAKFTTTKTGIRPFNIK